MRYKEAMEYITAVGNFGSNYGLDRTYRLLELLGNPQKELKVIHIAGTNGKGSTTAMISRTLIGLGYKVGMYTSPFLEEFEERIQINENNIDKEVLASLIDEIKEAVDKVIKEGFNHPTEFEIITALMYLYFYKEKVDFAVVEVGLGGRLDSTNVITPIVSVITSISYDHINILGDSLEGIAKEKAGIIKKGIPVVIYPQEENVLNVIKNKCLEENCELIVIDKGNTEILEIVKGDKHFQRVKTTLEINEYIIDLPLLGEHQSVNLAVALTVIETLDKNNYIKVNKKKVEEYLKSVKWIGRLEVLNINPLVVIDGAHNIQGISKLSENIKKYFDYKNLYLILGILADKDVEEMAKSITPLAKKVYAVTPNSIRAELANDLKNVVVKYNENCIAYEAYEEAVKDAFNKAEKDDLILASGSLYMIGDIRKIIRNR